MNGGLLLNLAVWLGGGAALGLVLSRWLRRDRGSGTWPNVGVGAGAALIVGLVAMPYLGTPGENMAHFSVAALLAALVGAVAALAIFNAVRANRRTR